MRMSSAARVSFTLCRVVMTILLEINIRRSLRISLAPAMRSRRGSWSVENGSFQAEIIASVRSSSSSTESPVDVDARGEQAAGRKANEQKECDLHLPCLSSVRFPTADIRKNRIAIRHTHIQTS